MNANDHPTATVHDQRTTRLIWLVPIAALIVAAWLAAQAWTQRGVHVTVRFDDGYGLEPGDVVRYRGIDIGRVDDIAIAPDLDGIDVRLRVERHANDIARGGTQFWIVRPQVGLTNITGLDTITGTRYIAVRPGAGRPVRRFLGLNTPPVVESIHAGDLEIVLQAPQRGSLHPGAPIRYRQVRIGTVLSVALASDGTAVEARAHIDEAFTPIVRTNSRFWDDGGLDTSVGLTGVDIRVDSLEALLVGGVSVATPDNAGEPVRTGARFPIAEDADDAWLTWRPIMQIGSPMLPAGTLTPQPLRAQLTWQQGTIRKRSDSRRGWVLPTDRGLLGPRNLLRPEQDARDDTSVLAISGQRVALDLPFIWESPDLGIIDRMRDANDIRRWPTLRIRQLDAPEDCLVIADPRTDARAVAAPRMLNDDDGWNFDDAIVFDTTWHGAAILAQSDGYLIGILILNDDDTARIATLPEQLTPP
ncbi:MAG: MlaD family protein [Planctomycetota bacterium]